ncbi:hypothetical protein [Paenibacillus silvae]|uniref:hypothetical protein n=1 Tax=Paenibacillus silvae TaxID=1325358 RepID=UPI0016432625|nr:hypothetical protein [Paenibacillus silvae]
MHKLRWAGKNIGMNIATKSADLLKRLRFLLITYKDHRIVVSGREYESFIRNTS